MIFSTFPDRHGIAVYKQSATAEELADLIRVTVRQHKEQLPLIKFALFGGRRTEKRCLRHDGNVVGITGIEGDYDGGEISFARAVEIAENAGLSAIIYTSPSYTVAEPRWRVLCPLSAELPPSERDRLMGRLGGLYDGAFAAESWALSQAYFVGRTTNGPTPLVAIISGKCIDQIDDLDATAIGKPNGIGNGAGGNAGPVDERALIEAIISGANYHRSSLSLLGHWASCGIGMIQASEAPSGIRVRFSARS
jgi:hypothetical protein